MFNNNQNHHISAISTQIVEKKYQWSHGVMVSTQDSESCNPSSNLGGTFFFFIFSLICVFHYSCQFLNELILDEIYFMFSTKLSQRILVSTVSKRWKTVFVGLSGGIDSSVSAYLLLKQVSKSRFFLFRDMM